MATLLAVAFTALVTAGPPVDPRLVGGWRSGGESFMVLGADGTGQMEAEPVRWTAAAGILTVAGQDGSADRVAYQVAGDTLSLALPTGTVRLTRAGGSSPEAGRAGTGTARGPVSPATVTARPAIAAQPGTAPVRAVRFNGRALDASGRQTLEKLERFIGRIPDGEYWYDPRTGGSGRWGGPTLAFLPAGLELGGTVPAGASGGGQGRLTGVFVNGREAHPVDVAGLQGLVGAVLPGRWWVDAAGNYGLEGGPPMGNLIALAQARRRSGQGGGTAWSRRYEGASSRDNMNLASDGNTTCVSVSGYSRCTGE